MASSDTHTDPPGSCTPCRARLERHAPEQPSSLRADYRQMQQQADIAATQLALDVERLHRQAMQQQGLVEQRRRDDDARRLADNAAARQTAAAEKGAEADEIARFRDELEQRYPTPSASPEITLPDPDAGPVEFDRAARDIRLASSLQQAQDRVGMWAAQHGATGRDRDQLARDVRLAVRAHYGDLHAEPCDLEAVLEQVLSAGPWPERLDELRQTAAGTAEADNSDAKADAAWSNAVDTVVKQRPAGGGSVLLRAAVTSVAAVATVLFVSGGWFTFAAQLAATVAAIAGGRLVALVAARIVALRARRHGAAAVTRAKFAGEAFDEAGVAAGLLIGVGAALLLRIGPFELVVQMQTTVPYATLAVSGVLLLFAASSARLARANLARSRAVPQDAGDYRREVERRLHAHGFDTPTKVHRLARGSGVHAKLWNEPVPGPDIGSA